MTESRSEWSTQHVGSGKLDDLKSTIPSINSFVLGCSVFVFLLRHPDYLLSPTCTVVGLTGGIATGKSTVAALLASHGIPIIDADLIARQVVEPGTRGHKQIVKAFGTGVLLPSSVGSAINSNERDWYTRPIDRKKLGSIIFNDEKQRKILNGIVHPAVTRAILWGVFKAWLRGEKLVVVDVPLLIEGGLWKWMGKVIVAYWCVWVFSLSLVSGVLIDFHTARSFFGTVPRNSNCSVSWLETSLLALMHLPDSTHSLPSLQRSGTPTSSSTTRVRLRISTER